VTEEATTDAAGEADPNETIEILVEESEQWIRFQLPSLPLPHQLEEIQQDHSALLPWAPIPMVIQDAEGAPPKVVFYLYGLKQPKGRMIHTAGRMPTGGANDFAAQRRGGGRH